MLKELAEMSVQAGIRADWIQAAGGNTSVKISDKLMYIKASGARLSEVTEKFGVSLVDYKMITDFLDSAVFDEKSESDILKKTLTEGTRPSIETFLHSFTGKYTLHTHPVIANVLLSTAGGMSELQNLFPKALCIGYHTPGLKLGAELYHAYQALPEPPEVIFLQNHGMIVSGESAQYVTERTQEVLDTISDYIGFVHKFDRLVSELYSEIKAVQPDFQGIVYHTENRFICQALRLFNGKMWKYRFCPDCIVYCGENIPDIKGNIRAFQDYIKIDGIPSVVLSQGELYIIASDMKKAVDIESVLAFSAKVNLYSEKREIQEIANNEQSFLTNWDAEKYRKQMK